MPGRSEEESAWLVGGDANIPAPMNATGSTGPTIRATGVRYTEETRNSSNSSPRSTQDTPSARHQHQELLDDANVLSQFHEDAIKQAKTGRFQAYVVLYIGICLAADAVEFLSIPYILPSTEVELCIKDDEQGWLGITTLLGTAIGGLLWGGLGDRLGRRRALLSAMSVHGLFSGVAAFMPTYGTFMTLRFFSAVGVGGALPLGFTYLAECCPMSSRGRWIALLVGAAGLGGVYTALLAWMIVPSTGEMVILENKEHFSAWHRFLVFCCLPTFCAIAGLIFLPESPRYLVEAGRDVEAMMVYQRIYKENEKEMKEDVGRNESQKNNSRVQYQLSELEFPNKRSRGLQAASSGSQATVTANMIYSVKLFYNSYLQLFSENYLNFTIPLLVIWSAAAFSLYGILAWCPEYLKLLKSIEYENEMQTITGTHFSELNFTSYLENKQYVNSSFRHSKFSQIVLSHVSFINCTFDSVEFVNVKSSKTYFINSNFNNVNFTDTDFYEQVFINCKTTNVTKIGVQGPCPSLDLDYNIYIEETLYGHLVAELVFIFAAIFSGLLLFESERRSKIIGIPLLFATGPVFCLLLLNNHVRHTVLFFEGVYILNLSFSWTALTLTTIESYPTYLRCTGFGLMAVAIKLSGLIGNLVYQNLVGAPMIVPVLLTGATLSIASITSFKLPHTHTLFL